MLSEASVPQIYLESVLSCSAETAVDVTVESIPRNAGFVRTAA